MLKLLCGYSGSIHALGPETRGVPCSLSFWQRRRFALHILLPPQHSEYEHCFLQTAFFRFSVPLRSPVGGRVFQRRCLPGQLRFRPARAVPFIS